MDQDNSKTSKTNCAKYHTGGWWYNHCSWVRLTGTSTTTKKHKSQYNMWLWGGKRGVSMNAFAEAELLLVPKPNVTMLRRLQVGNPQSCHKGLLGKGFTGILFKSKNLIFENKILITFVWIL